jgi:signal transduction histidine kinase
MDPKDKEFFQYILITSAVIGILVIYFLVTIIRQQRRNARLQRERVYTEITTLETERKRIANDLHDEVGPMLAVVRMNINNFSAIAPQDAAQVQKTTIHVDSLIKRLREISADLLPTVLVRQGLVKALKMYVEDVNDNGGLQIECMAKADLEMPKAFEVVLYRICLEIIHNTLKHSQAQKMQLEMRNENQKLLILSQDNGRGFEINKIAGNKAGLGLQSIASRTQMMGGECTFESQIGKGTKIVIEIPL